MSKRARNCFAGICSFAILLLCATANAKSMDEGVDLDGLKEWKGEIYGMNGTIRYVEANSKVVDKKRPLEEADPQMAGSGFEEHLAIETKIDSSNQKYRISFAADPSNDPHFTIWRMKPEGGEEWAGSVPGLGVAIPGNGYLYTWGHADNYFNEHRKFQWKNGEPQEVKQPFQYAGLETQTLKPITLYADRDYKDVVTKIPANTPIEVLLGQDKELLIKSPADLVGWMQYEDAWIEKDGRTLPDPSIEGVFYAGD